MLLLIASLVALSSTACARFGGIQDVDSFPKYSVSFLNALPVTNETAQSWLQHGLAGGESEFLEAAPTPSLKRIESGDEPSEYQNSGSPQAQHVQHLRFGAAASYVCLIPPARPLPHPSEELEPAPTPSKTWELLQPLSGKCLYHRQGWFTYSYCHNQHVRQFRELPDQPSVTFPPVAKVPEEDPEYPSYTLGKSAQAEDGSISEAANNLELARGTGQRYLHFRWADGTVCDKTGKRRAVEVQFHCAMSVTDTIVFVKETRTCEYTLVIHTPRLCSEPGFRRVLDEIPAQPIRCREVLPAGATPDGVKTIPSQPGEPATGGPGLAEGAPSSHPLFESPHPKQFQRRPVTRLPLRPTAPEVRGKDDKEADDKNAALRRVLEALLGTKLDLPSSGSKGDGGKVESGTGAPGSTADNTDDALSGALADLPIYRVRQRRLANGETVIELEVDEDNFGDDGADDEEYDEEYDDEGDLEDEVEVSDDKKLRVAEALRAAGYDVRTLNEMHKAAKKAGSDSRDSQASKDKSKGNQKHGKKKSSHVEL